MYLHTGEGVKNVMRNYGIVQRRCRILASNPGLLCSFFRSRGKKSDFFHGCEKKLRGRPGFEASRTHAICENCLPLSLSLALPAQDNATTSCTAAGFQGCCTESVCQLESGCFCDQTCYTASDCCSDIALTCQPG